MGHLVSFTVYRMHSAYGKSDMQAIFSNSGSHGPLPSFLNAHVLTALPQFDMPEGEWYEKDR